MGVARRCALEWERVEERMVSELIDYRSSVERFGGAERLEELAPQEL